MATAGLVIATLAPLVLAAGLAWWILSIAYKRRGRSDHQRRALIVTVVIVAACSVPLIVGSVLRVMSD